MAIRIVDKVTGKAIEAKGGKDAAMIVGNVLNRQWYEQNIGRLGAAKIGKATQ